MFSAAGNILHFPKNMSKQLNLCSKRTLNAATANDGKFIVVAEAPNQQQRQQSRQNEAERVMKFASVWLRDNCTCCKCFHESSKSRQIDWHRFDVNVKARNIECDRGRGQIKIMWNDGHQSTYDLDWLKEREFSKDRVNKYLNDFYRPKAEHWRGADFEKICQHFDYKTVMQDDKALHDWLQALAVWGVAIIADAPSEKTVVRQLAERVGFIRRTTYGEEFIVQAKPGAKNYAYLSTPLPLHTDLPYYEYKPSVNILHCMTQSASAGGSNLLVDAFHIADTLKSLHAKDYEILTKTLVDWNDIGSEDNKSFHNIWRAPVICLDSEGNYTRINHSVPQRDSHFSVESVEHVLPWYEAYSKFVHLARRDAYAFKTKPGNVLTFNNIRLLHGRTGYDDTATNIRYIIGAYLDWDIIYSKLRVLKTNAAAVAAAAETQTRTAAAATATAIATIDTNTNGNTKH